MFRFFASLKLAVVLLILLAAVLAVATSLESLYGTRAAKYLVYGTPWFAGLLFLLGVSLATAAIVRYPWKRHQTGFVMTHLGIIVILVGAWVTSRFGVDGNLPIGENTSSHEVILSDLVLSVEPEGGENHTTRIPEFAHAKEGPLHRIEFVNATLRMDHFVPRAVVTRSVRESPLKGVGSPAIRVELGNDRFSVVEWLFHQGGPAPTVLDLGPAQLSLEVFHSSGGRWPFEQSNNSQRSDLGMLEFAQGGKEFRIRIADALKRWMRLGSGLEVYVEKYFPYATVIDNQLVSKSNQPVNPAVRLRLRNARGVEESHTVFALFPQFAVRHRTRKGSTTNLDVSIRMVVSVEPPERERKILKFAQSVGGQALFYRLMAQPGAKGSGGQVVLGKTFPTGWMDLSFKVQQWLPYAVQEQLPRSVDRITDGSANYLAAAHFAFESAYLKEPFWLFEGERRVLPFINQMVSVALRRNTLALPFRIHLDKFTIHRDPGSERAAEFESRVTVHDGAQTHSAQISMNRPLEYAGYSFYQASYQLEEGAPPVSVLSVNYDPGRWLKYVGSMLLVLGIVTMFYMNPHYWSILLDKKKERV